MSDLNVDIKQGNLVDKPEVTEFENGDKVARFSIATSESWQREDGEWDERTSYFDVEVRGQRAETIEGKLDKGNRVIVEGKTRQDRWEDDDGNTRSSVKTVAYRVQKIGYPEKQDPQDIIDETEVDGVEEGDLFEESTEVI